MKIFSPKETKDHKEEEIARDILRVQTVREALKKSQTELDDTNARFEIALANQRLRWTQEESEAIARISELNREIRDLEQRILRFVPIESNGSKVDNLEELLQDKLDEVSERESNLDFREKILIIREAAVALEKSDISSKPQKIF